MKELGLTIIVDADGVYVSIVERTDDTISGQGTLNKRFDAVSIDIAPYSEPPLEIPIKELDDLES